MNGCWRAEKLRSGSVSTPFPMKRISQVIPCGFSSDKNRAIGVQRLKHKNNPTETSFPLHVNSQGRIVLHIFRFHTVNAIGILLSSILQRESCTVYDEHVQRYVKLD